MGGSFTPHGSLLNRYAHSWAVCAAWFLVLAGSALIGLYDYRLDYFSRFSTGATAILFALSFIALAFRLSFLNVDPEANKPDSIPNYERFRIYCPDPLQYAQLCNEPDVSSRMEDTAFTSVFEIPRAGLKAALKLVPGLRYQPVEASIMNLLDKQYQAARAECESHTEKALTAQSETDALQVALAQANERIALLEKSEESARKDLERMQSRSRASNSKNPADMTLDELKILRNNLMDELRKVDQTIRNITAPGTISQANIPNINP
jgi:hypothetical protein